MISRFYCPKTDVTLVARRPLTLPDVVAHHALKVLRLRVDDELVLFDGSGGEYPGYVLEANRKLTVMLDEWREV